MSWWRVASGVWALLLLGVGPISASGQGAAARDDGGGTATAGEWRSYGGDAAETHHSPLNQITAANVNRLGLAWSVEVGSEARIESTPLFVDGALYGTTTWSTVFAIDARKGTLKWRWDPAIVRTGLAGDGPRFCCGPANRGLAYHDGKVFAGLLDGRLVALEAETGKVAWAVQTTPPGSDYSITGAPRVVKGKVVIGNSGAEYGVRGYVTAYDAQSGARAWRFYTVPGDPSLPFENAAMERAAKTWSGEWWRVGGGGGSVWDGMAYDPEADLLYIGTGNGSPWNQEIRSPGGGDNLFLSSIVALRPDTGEYVWHYQTTPGENWDFTSTQPMILADLTLNGRVRKVLMQAPKNGFFYVLDRLTGEFLSAEPYVEVTWASHVDWSTGRPVENPRARYGLEPVILSPGPIGGHNWPPMAWNPATRLVYFAGQESNVTISRDPAFKYEVGKGNRGVIRTSRTLSGFIAAWDPVAQKARWRIEHTVGGGLLSTAGNLVFGGNGGGFFFALDATTGNKLWERRLFQGTATPISYELDGRQYVAVLSGAIGGRVFTFVLDGQAPIPSRTQP